MKNYLLLLLLPFLLIACHKDDNTVTQPTAAEYFLPLKTGNYWIYRRTTEVGAYPNYTINTDYDTLRITRDTLIDGLRFYQVTGNDFTIILDGWYGDSAGSIIDPWHHTFPLSLTANDTLYVDTADANFYSYMCRSGNTDTAITTPAGSFNCTEMVLDMYYANSAPPAPNTNPRPQLQYFAKGVGLVKAKTFFASQPGQIVSELHSYYVQP